MTGPTDAPASSGLSGTRIREVSLRRVAKLVAGVVLIAAGLLVALHVSPELGTALLGAGVNLGVDGLVLGHDDRRHRRPALAVA